MLGIWGVLRSCAMSSRVRRQVGRYLLLDKIASGGAATVHLGRLLGSEGFSRTVAIKRLHPAFSEDPGVVTLFLEEARLASRIRHPNVLATLDVVSEAGELLLVMEYVPGLSLYQVMQALSSRGEPMPVTVACGIVGAALIGLHAAHEAKNDQGLPLQLVHRDVSPQNLLVGRDGVVRVGDFGIAKAAGRVQSTREGEVKGKAPYMAPEQVRGRPLDRRTDVYAASVVLWEALTGQRLFTGDSPLAVMTQVLEKPIVPARQLRPGVPESVDAIVRRGLSRQPSERFATAEDMAMALEGAVGVLSSRELGAWVERVDPETLKADADRLLEVESTLPEVLPPEAGSAPVAPRSRRPWLVAAGAVGLGLAALVSWYSTRFASASNEPPAAPSPLPPSEGVAAPTPPPVAAPAVVAAPPPEVAPVKTVVPGSGTPPRTRGPSPKADGKAHCNPPYTVDADGTRHWKSGC